MTAEQYSDFYSHLHLFRWFRHTRQVHLLWLRLAREGKREISKADWSSRMKRCRRCKQRMRELIHQMENIVRPYSSFLQEHRP